MHSVRDTICRPSVGLEGTSEEGTSSDLMMLYGLLQGLQGVFFVYPALLGPGSKRSMMVVKWLMVSQW